jgi:hypothetical protein
MNLHPTKESTPCGQAEGTSETIKPSNSKRKLCEDDIRLCRALLARQQASRKELEPMVSTYIPNQIKSLRDNFGFEICMTRFKYNPLKPGKWYGVFSFTSADRLRALQLLGSQECNT